MRIEVTHNETDLTRDLYGFTFDLERGFVLTEYRQQTRASKRHKWTGLRWHSASYHDSNIAQPTDIPLTVRLKARQIAIERIGTADFRIGWRGDPV